MTIYRLEWIKLDGFEGRLIGRYEEVGTDLERLKKMARELSKHTGMPIANGDGTHTEPNRRMVCISLWKLEEGRKPKFVEWWDE